MQKLSALICLLLSVGSSLAAQNAPKPAANVSKSQAPSEANETKESSSRPAAKLPVRKVVLYKNGVGYFEHLGQVRGNQGVHIDFTSGQLNDVLKSLTVLDLNGGRITGVDYNSEAPLARRLATLRLALGERPTVAEFLGSLRGARLEVRNGAAAAVSGRLLSVERKTRTGANAGWTVETDEISLITDGGEVRTVDLSSATSVRIAEKDLQVEVGKYLGLIASSRDQDVRRMEISTTGTGERSLYVSYISEVPIWKTTYRIVLSSKAEKKPLLQGWAIVDNTVGEDWDGVELSLVAGAPHSFIQQLSEPFYGRRPVVALPESVQLSPQTHAAMLTRGNGRLVGTVTDPMGATIAGADVKLLDDKNNVIAQTTTDGNGQYTFADVKGEQFRVEIEERGFKKAVTTGVNIVPGENRLNSQLQLGATAETVMVQGESVDTLNTTSSSVTSTGFANKLPVANRSHVPNLTMNGRNFGALAAPPPGIAAGPAGGMAGGSFRAGVEAVRASGEAGANGEELGDLFEYKLKDRVTLKKNQSGLVPIVQTEIEAEKVSLWSDTGPAGRPLRGLWLKNSSSLTLDGGSFSVLENEVFAGEGITDPIKPGERRLISYATDLGLVVEAAKSGQPQHVSRVKISKGVLTQVSELRERTVYTARNQSDTARTLVIEHAARPDWQLVKGTKEPDEKAPGVHRFRMEIAPKATSSLPIEEVRNLTTTYQLATLNDDQVALFSRQGAITPEMTEAFRKIAALKASVAKLEDEMENRQKDIDRIVEDQVRLRENMKALRGSAEEKALLQRYTRQLDEQENQLETLRKNIKATEAQRDAVNDQLEKLIDGLEIESSPA